MIFLQCSSSNAYDFYVSRKRNLRVRFHKIENCILLFRCVYILNSKKIVKQEILFIKASNKKNLYCALQRMHLFLLYICEHARKLLAGHKYIDYDKYLVVVSEWTAATAYYCTKKPIFGFRAAHALFASQWRWQIILYTVRARSQQNWHATRPGLQQQQQRQDYYICEWAQRAFCKKYFIGYVYICMIYTKFSMCCYVTYTHLQSSWFGWRKRGNFNKLPYINFNKYTRACGPQQVKVFTICMYVDAETWNF